MASSHYSKCQFLASPVALLKLFQILLLLVGLLLFLLGGECSEDVVHVVLFSLPVAMCCFATLISYITAIVMLVRGRNPVMTATWVKGDIVFNVAALVLVVFGLAISMGNTNCLTETHTIAATVLCGVVTVLYATSGSLIYLLHVRHQEHVREQQQQRQQGAPATESRASVSLSIA